MSKVGLFYGTQTSNTQTAAEMIQKHLVAVTYWSYMTSPRQKPVILQATTTLLLVVQPGMLGNSRRLGNFLR